MAGLLMAIGAATPAGLNAFLVLLIVGLAARVTGRVDLPPGLTWLGETWALVAIGAVLTVDIFITKSPQYGPISDRIGLLARPLAGGIVAVAVTVSTGANVVLMAALGVLCAGSVHFLKVAARRRLSAATGGLAVPLASLMEDMIAAAGVFLTLLAPPAGFAIALSIVVALAAVLMVVRPRLPRPGPHEPPSSVS